ncbi:hypothetical protein [Microbulbifer hainanensis]|uniref:hypothetical protein n=1 Tax=Microbulbifer hainanensis TaxID=2735675 RepID=UPI001D0048CB|nr:hypothetical protein [Microbulbifer hainanensis]
MKFLRRQPSPQKTPSSAVQTTEKSHPSPGVGRSVLWPMCQAYVVIFVLFLLLPLAAAAESGQRQWAGNWLVVGEGDEQLVWQLQADGTGFAYGFQPDGRLSHGFAISWKLEGDRVQVRTGASVRCNAGVVKVAFTGWSPVTLKFAVVDGRHWLQDGGALLSFQRRLASWTTPRAGSECPAIKS